MPTSTSSAAQASMKGAPPAAARHRRQIGDRGHRQIRRRDADAHHARHRRHALLVEHEQHVVARRHIAGARRAAARSSNAAVRRERQLQVALVHVEAVRDRTGLDEGDAARRCRRPKRRPRNGRPASTVSGAETISGRAARAPVAVEQIRRVVDFGVEVDSADRARRRRRPARWHRAAAAPIAWYRRALTAEAPSVQVPGGGVPDLGAVVHAGELVLDRAAAGAEHLAVRQHGGGYPLPLRRHRLRGRHHRLRAVDVDDQRGTRGAAASA